MRGTPEEMVKQLDQFYANKRNHVISVADGAMLVNWGANVAGDRSWVSLVVQSYRSYGNFMRVQREGKRLSVAAPLAQKVEVTPGPFGQAQRPDGTTESYYSLDPYIGAALYAAWPRLKTPEKTNWYQRRQGADLVRLKTLLRYRPAAAANRLWLHKYFDRVVGKTSLVPEGYHGERPPLKDCHDHSWVLQALMFVRRAAQWFPDDLDLLRKAEQVHEGIVRRHFVQGKGFYNFVDVNTGQRAGPKIVIPSFPAGEAAAALYVATGKEKYKDVARELSRVPWQCRREESTALVPRAIDIEGVEPYTWDTDAIYWLRRLKECHEATGDEWYKEPIVRTADDYVRFCWSDEVGMFLTRGMYADGSPYTDYFCGDAHFNSIYLLCHAAELTGDRKYLGLARRQLRTARDAQGTSGLFGLITLVNGKPEPYYGYSQDDYGNGQCQCAFLRVMLQTYLTSGEAKDLEEAREFADLLLKVGPKYWGYPHLYGATYAFLELAAARRAHARVEIAAPMGNWKLDVEGKGGQMSVVVPNEAAVVYLPKGPYTIRITCQGRTKTVEINAQRDMSVGA